jgi:hypothetical protein
MIVCFRRRRAVHELYLLAARHEIMRRLSDNFGFGPLLRYGNDRYGTNRI